MFNLSALKGWFGSNPAAMGPIQAAPSAASVGFKGPFGMAAAGDAFKQATFAPTGMQRMGQRVQGFMQDPRAQMGMAMLANRGQQDIDPRMLMLMAQRAGIFGGGK